MKRILSLFLLAMPLFCHGQNIYEINLSRTLDESRIAELTDSFYNSQYDIGKLMETIFKSAWFYEDKNIALAYKSSIDSSFEFYENQVIRNNKFCKEIVNGKN